MSGKNGRNGIDRRRWRRTASRLTEVVVLTAEGDSRPGAVVDESLTGVSVQVCDVGGLQAGQDVRLAKGKHQVAVTLRNIGPEKDGGYRLGLEWGPSAVKPASLVLLRPQEAG